jgi:glucokinase
VFWQENMKKYMALYIMLKPLLEKISRKQYSRGNMAKTQIKVASLGNDAGIIGAAVLGV